MTKEELFSWASEAATQYPELSELKEEKMRDTNILKLTVPYGKYKGLIVTFDKTFACALRRRSQAGLRKDKPTQEPYAVAVVGDYIEAQEWFTECVAWIKKNKRRNRKK